MTITIPPNAVGHPVTISISADDPAPRAFPSGVTYAVHVDPPVEILGSRINYRYTNAEMRAAESVDSNGTPLVFPAIEDEATSPEPLRIAYLTGTFRDLAYADADRSIGYARDGAWGTFVGDVPLPIEDLALRLMPVRYGAASATRLDAMVVGQPVTLRFYLQTSSVVEHYAVDRVLSGDTANMGDHVMRGEFHEQLDQTSLGPSTTKWDSYTLTCTSAGSGSLSERLISAWQQGDNPPSGVGVIAYTELVIPYTCLEAGSTSSSAPDWGAIGAPQVMVGQGIVQPTGGVVTSEDGEFAIEILPVEMVEPVRVSVVEHGSANPREFDVSLGDGVRGVDAQMRYALANPPEPAGDDGEPLAFVPPGDGGFPGEGFVGHFLTGVVTTDDGGVELHFGHTQVGETMVFDGSLWPNTLPATGLGVRVSPVRIGLSTTDGNCCARAPWPARLQVGAAPVSYFLYWQSATNGPPYTVVMAEAVNASTDILEVLQPRNDFQTGEGALSAPGETLLLEVTVRCTAAGNGFVVLSTSGGAVPFTEADWEFLDMVLPVECIAP